jgi:hypothetical protein
MVDHRRMLMETPTGLVYFSKVDIAVRLGLSVDGYPEDAVAAEERADEDIGTALDSGQVTNDQCYIAYDAVFKAAVVTAERARRNRP